MLFVVYEKILLGDAVAELDDFEVEAVQANALVAILAEDQRLAVLELNDVLAARVFFRDVRPRAVVEDIAILQNFHVRRALVGRGFFQRVLQVLLEDVDRARDERGFGADRERNRIERAVGGAVGRGFRFLADFGRRRILALSSDRKSYC